MGVFLGKLILIQPLFKLLFHRCLSQFASFLGVLLPRSDSPDTTESPALLVSACDSPFVGVHISQPQPTVARVSDKCFSVLRLITSTQAMLYHFV